MIPPARWRLTCYVCKEKGIGACIQCLRNNCYAAFHVTCAQQAGLYMRMDTVKDSGNEAHPVQVQKIAYCHTHTPADAKNDSDFEKAREETRHKMKEARKLLAKKRSSVPLILIPTIPTDRVQEISGLVSMQKKAQFIQRLIAYWTLKRQYRNGVPLLRRLQSQGQSHSSFGRNGIEGLILLLCAMFLSNPLMLNRAGDDMVITLMLVECYLLLRLSFCFTFFNIIKFLGKKSTLIIAKLSCSNHIQFLH